MSIIITTLCGSSRFPEAFALANMHLSMTGRIVLGLTCYGHADLPIGAKFLLDDANENNAIKKRVDLVHFEKIGISHGIYVVNPGNYIGTGTLREIRYAVTLGKSVEWMFPQPNASDLVRI